MRDTRFAFVLLAFLALVTAAVAQPPGRRRDPLPGDYRSESGGACTVARVGRDYIFTNDKGTSARYRFSGPDTLVWVGGGWDPNVVATVSRGRLGRIQIRFDAPRTPPGFWTRVD
jgi:hypothetical protein